MNKEYFYVNLVPEISFSQMGTEPCPVKVDDVNALARLSLTLTPEVEVTEAFGYASALGTYFRENDDELKESYSKLTSDSTGNEFLCTTIALSLFEKSFRENGISDDMMERYNRIVDNYQKQLKVNNEHYEALQNEGKSK